MGSILNPLCPPLCDEVSKVAKAMFAKLTGHAVPNSIEMFVQTFVIVSQSSTILCYLNSYLSQYPVSFFLFLSMRPHDLLFISVFYIL